MAKACGFPEERYDEVFITLDKMDKIGLEGVEQELLEEGFDAAAAGRYRTLFEGLNASENPLSYLEEKLAGVIEEEVIPNLRETIETVEATKQADFKLVFDPTIVRGMSYYTGTIFEIAMPELGISAGGGGRYDGMVGKFTGKDVPACGFSIGFERIILILLEQGFQVPGKGEKAAFLLEKGLSGERLKEAIEKAQKYRAEGKSVLVVRMNKNKKFQKQQLEAQGYVSFEEFYQNPIG